MKKNVTRKSTAAVAIAALSLALEPAFAGTGSETWPIDATTTGGDVVWVSPTTVDASAYAYRATATFQLVEVGVSWLGIPLGSFDVTDQVPREMLTISQIVPGPAPVALVENDVVAPPPPDPTAVSLHLAFSLDSSGFAHVTATQVDLGTAQVNLGPPFGVQTVTITSIHIELSLEVDALSACALADTDESGDVGFNDLTSLLLGWGACPADPGCAGDIDLDGVVGFGDLTLMLLQWGPC